MTSFNSIASLKAQRQLGTATAALSRSSERLSSGLRINSASDDAAGLAISSTLKRDSKLYSVANRNVNDGVSALNIAQGALQNQNGIITRLQELAEQAANGVYSTSQRRGMNVEYQELLREFGRIGDTTSLNNINLLLGGRGSNSSSINIQAGISGSSNSSLNFQLSDSGSLSGTIQVNATQAFPDPSAGVAYSLDTLMSTIGVAGARFKVTDSLGVQREAIAVLGPDGGSGGLNINVFVRGSDSDGTISSSNELWVGAGSAQQLTFSTTTGKFIGSSTSQVSLVGLAGNATAATAIDLSGLSFTYGTSVANTNTIGLTGIETQSQARTSLTVLSQRLTDSSQALGKIGAAQSRLQIAANVLSVMKENVQAANSRIEDVDVANETAQYVASQIQQQVAVSVLAQANSQPEFLLGILKAA